MNFTLWKFSQGNANKISYGVQLGYIIYFSVLLLFSVLEKLKFMRIYHFSDKSFWRFMGFSDFPILVI